MLRAYYPTSIDCSSGTPHQLHDVRVEQRPGSLQQHRHDVQDQRIRHHPTDATRKRLQAVARGSIVLMEFFHRLVPWSVIVLTQDVTPQLCERAHVLTYAFNRGGLDQGANG